MGSQKVWHNWATELNWTEGNVWIELLKVNTSCILPYCCSVTQSCLTLCNLMNCSMPGFPVPHHLPEFVQVHVHCISVPSSHLILWCQLLLLPSIFPSIRSFPIIQLFSSGDQNTGASASTSILPRSIQSWFPLRLTDLISFLSKGLSEVFSSTTVWRHKFFGALPSLWSSSHNHMWPLGRPWPW